MLRVDKGRERSPLLKSLFEAYGQLRIQNSSALAISYKKTTIKILKSESELALEILGREEFSSQLGQQM